MRPVVKPIGRRSARTTWLIVLGCILGGSTLLSLLQFVFVPSRALVYVDNSLSVEIRVLVDGEEVGRVFPNLMEKFVLPGGNHVLAVREPSGKVSEQIEVSLYREGRFIYNPGASRQYELVTEEYGSVGPGGRTTRILPTARWREVDRVDYLFEGFPATEYSRGGGTVTKTQLTRRFSKK